jgi:hypothetical protein
MKKPNNLSSLSKEDLIKIINDLFVKIDALEAEIARIKKFQANQR